MNNEWKDAKKFVPNRGSTGLAHDPEPLFAMHQADILL